MVKHFKKKYKHIGLSAAESEQMRDTIIAYTRAHPAEVRIEKGARHTSRKPFGFFSLLLANRPMLVTLLVAFVMAVSGGTTLAAESTIPGDFLYPVKVHVNENVRSAFHVSEESKAGWEAARAERRLEEAAVLAQNGELRSEVSVKLEQRMEAHIDRAKAHIEKLEEAGELEAAAAAQARLEASMRTHQKFFEDLSELEVEIENTSESDTELTATTTTTTTTAPIERILKQLDRKLEVQDKVRTKIETRVENATDERAAQAATRAKHTVEIQLRTTLHVIERYDRNVDAKARAEAQYRQALELKATADTEFEAENYKRAFSLYNQALGLLAQIKTALHLQMGIGLDINADVKVRTNSEVKDENVRGNSASSSAKIKQRIEALQRDDNRERNDREPEDSDTSDAEASASSEAEVEVNIGEETSTNASTGLRANTLFRRAL